MNDNQKNKRIAIVGSGSILSSVKESLNEYDVEVVEPENESDIPFGLYTESMKDRALKIYNMVEELGGLYDGLTKKQRLKAERIQPVRNSANDPKIQNNDPCYCGSGIKYKKCCK